VGELGRLFELRRLEGEGESANQPGSAPKVQLINHRIQHHTVGNRTILSICDMAGTLHFYSFTSKLVLIDSLAFGNNVQQIQAFLVLDQNNLLVALGGIDTKVHLYLIDWRKYELEESIVKEESEKEPIKSQIQYLVSLAGHENVIMGLSF
jgi:hypothetical protein